MEGDALSFGPARIGHPKVQSLSRSLPVAHGQQQSRSIEEIAVVPQQEQRDSDEQPCQSLQDIGAGGDRSRLDNFHGGGGAPDFLVFQGHGHESQPEGMVGDYLHRGLVDQSGKEAERFQAQDKQSRQQSRGQQAALKQRDVAAYKVSHQQGDNNDEELYQPSPG